MDELACVLHVPLRQSEEGANKDFVHSGSTEFLKFVRDCSFPKLGEWMRTVLIVIELERRGEHEWLRYFRR